MYPFRVVAGVRTVTAPKTGVAVVRGGNALALVDTLPLVRHELSGAMLHDRIKTQGLVERTLACPSPSAKGPITKAPQPHLGPPIQPATIHNTTHKKGLLDDQGAWTLHLSLLTNIQTCLRDFCLRQLLSAQDPLSNAGGSHKQGSR